MPRINHNVPAMITGNSLRATDRNLAKSLEKLSTGLRINRAADDAAGLSISEQLRTQVGGLSMGTRNAQDGIALFNIAEGALHEVNSMMQRMRELSIQAANDTLTSTDRSFVQAEITQLTTEIDRIVGGAQYNGMSLLNGDEPWGTGLGGVLHIGANYEASDNIIQFKIDSISTESVGIATTDISLTAQSSATAAISALDEALSSVNTLRANIGSIVNRLEHALTSQENQVQNMQAAESVIRDADFAHETTEYTKHQILMQSSNAMLAQANVIPQNVLNLLQG
ncbi:MAG: flagellin [Fibrobacter sp.]|nr:flagellin [Fibrobacter sp.]